VPETTSINDQRDATVSMHVDFGNPINQGALGYLRGRNKKPGLKSASPSSVKDPLRKTSTHPEIGERLWDELATSLPVDCRWIVCGAPVLVHPQTGVLFAVGIGMSYCLRLTEVDMRRALSAGGSTSIAWSDGSTLDLVYAFGPDWVKGGWQHEEVEWCRAVYEALGRAEGTEDSVEKRDSSGSTPSTPNPSPAPDG
jgi:hypothetical protein